MDRSGAGHAHAHAHTLPPLSSTTTDAEQQSSHIPVEMSNLDSKRPAADSGAGAGTQGLLNDVSIPTSSPIDTTFQSTSIMAQSAPGVENSKPEPVGDSSRPTTTPQPAAAEQQTTTETGDSSSQPAIQRLDSVAIGPSTDGIATPTTTTIEAGPSLTITLLLGTGARHPYRIDEKYLTKRNVTVPGMTEGGRKDPFSISVYTLKELILREWREEWEPQPSSPSSIRLIYFGRLLDDKTPLKDCKFNAESANVVHMTVRPQDIVDEEDASKSKALARDREGGESTAGCRCVVQ
ncbi:hypothetical protein VTL71DRAFT_2499 [Oculimacula yallundae]|uniref:Ubiquitin-like domain-containing protein n=1 Tax=Oculimacula yallundae TaxID=86028 RepID=A0ABR4CBA9_9HELO